MNIVHYPITNIKKVEELYSDKDGVPVKHVCTTEFGDSIVDVFYRDTPHPKFGNKYFSLYFKVSLNQQYDQLMIANADQVEDLSFGMVENDEGNLEYSQHRHDYKSFNNGNMIDGGRDYIRSSGKVFVHVIRDGKMIRHGVNNVNI
jgi:hypothetical protein